MSSDPSAGDPEAPAIAEEVESTPLTATAGAEGVTSWADASEEVPSTEPTGEVQELVPVKEEQEQLQEAESLGAVLSVIGIPEEVADAVATEEDSQQPSSEAHDQPFASEQLGQENPAEAAFAYLDRAKEESAKDPPSSPSEGVPIAESTDLLGLEESSADVVNPVGVGEAAEPEASEPPPTVADPSGVATEATTVDTSDLVPPPTSPNLVEPGTEPVRVGHSPAASSREPRRQRHRGSRGGQTTRWQEALREWWLDFEKVQRWLYNNSGGAIARGFWLERVSLEDVDSQEKWFVCNFHLQDFLTTSQLLALAYFIWPHYTEWAHSHGLDRRRGVSHGRQVIDGKTLPPKTVINRNILGVEHPPDDYWDRYFRY